MRRVQWVLVLTVLLFAAALFAPAIAQGYNHVSLVTEGVTAGHAVGEEDIEKVERLRKWPILSVVLAIVSLNIAVAVVVQIQNRNQSIKRREL